MNGHPVPPSRQTTSAGWAAYNALDDTQRPAPPSTASPSWLAGIVPPSYHQAVLPVHLDDRRAPSLLRRIGKLLRRSLPSRDTSSYPRRTSLTRQPSSDSWLSPPSGDTVRFVLLCALWYSSSALSSNTGKVILTQFRYPVTLTFVQFGFVAAFCLAFMSPAVQFSKLRRPTRAIIKDTLPMGIFQVGGHIFSSMAISRIPVSTVHTIKALSPLFTVAAYALLFGVAYSPRTYISLLPLTVGVMLACSFDVSASNMTGLLCAFGSAIIFVSQNIFFKKVMPPPSAHAHATGGAAHKLDKLNLLLYSSSMAFALMVPIWCYYDLPALLAPPDHIVHPAHPAPVHSSIMPYLLANGTVHFLQNVLAFVLLARTSPVTYSIASLIKRVAVICAAVLWFSQRVHALQGAGIALTFVGLYMYNGAVKKGDLDRGERKARRVERAWEGALPQTKDEVDSETEGVALNPIEVQAQQAYARAQVSHPPTHPPYTASYSQTHAHPNLHIHIAPHPPPTSKGKTNSAPVGMGITGVAFGAGKQPDERERVASPTESYPSPPPSLDSPPGSSAVLQSPWSAAVPMKKRAVTGHAHAHHTHAHGHAHGHALEFGRGSGGGFMDVPRAAMPMVAA
ncbi:hypothetical protein EIP86_005404 [Pleurotus ostreatoroseus]|nr:hypothetical protein EIP86_005404 [Pleurotus ostreatoroseus]